VQPQATPYLVLDQSTTWTIVSFASVASVLSFMQMAVKSTLALAPWISHVFAPKQFKAATLIGYAPKAAMNNVL
jgi:hypothetical protein